MALAAAAAPALQAKVATATVAPQVQQLLVDDGSSGQRLDNFLLRTLKGVPKTHIYRVIRSGEVRVNGGRSQADARLAEGDRVRLPPVRVAQREEGAAATVPAREFAVLFEDEHLLAIDKPAGVAVHGGSGVSFGVIEQLRRARPEARFLELVHRLDRETSGVLLLAKKRSALTALQDQFRQPPGDKRVLVKRYSALVLGAWPEKLKVLDTPLRKTLDAQGERRVLPARVGDADAQRAVTLVKVAQRFEGFSLLDVTLKTGRTHQIRVHLQNAGFPIAGDARYGDFEANRQLARQSQAPRLSRMFLHARELHFSHPASGEPLHLKAALPAECLNFIAQLPTESLH